MAAGAEFNSLTSAADRCEQRASCACERKTITSICCYETAFRVTCGRGGESVKDGIRCDSPRKVRTQGEACAACETPGACCLDAHFVNVHITRLEAAAIGKVLARLPKEQREKVYQRIEDAVETYELSAEGDTFRQKFACPLYEKGTGCLVHHEGKPLPCIQHACYEAAENLPRTN